MSFVTGYVLPLRSVTSARAAFASALQAPTASPSADHKDALLMLMLAAEMRDSAKYEGYVNDYLEAFP